jgi:hypothetical protein
LPGNELKVGQRQIDLAKVIAKWKGIGYQTQMRIKKNLPPSLIHPTENFLQKSDFFV